MILYQVKIKIDAPAEQEWLQWMKTVHVPDVLATGVVLTAQVCRSEDQAHTYYFNYYFSSKDQYELYHTKFGPKLKADTQKHYGGKFQASRQILEMI